MAIHEDYLDVLQNIEFAILSVFREHSTLSDYAVMSALDAAIGRYNAERRGHQPKPVSLRDHELLIYERVKDMCEWRLGRGEMGGDGRAPTSPDPITTEEILACLRKIRKSPGKL